MLGDSRVYGIGDWDLQSGETVAEKGGCGGVTLNELAVALAARGLIEPHQQFAIESEDRGSPWYVQAMMGLCAWIAGLLLLAFVVLVLNETLFRGRDNWDVVLILSTILCALAGLVYQVTKKKGAFLDQFTLAMSIAGQVGILVAVGAMSKSARPVLWAAVALEIAMVAVMRNRLHRTISSTAAVIAWALAIHELAFPKQIFGLSHEAVAGNDSVVLQILYWLLVWCPVALAAWWLVRRDAAWMSAGRDELCRPMTHGLLAALAIAPLATHPVDFWLAMGMNTGVMASGSLSAIPLWPFMAALLALLSLGLAFELRSRALMGVAIVFSLLELSAFYYVLGTTLLIKSAIMLAMGIALLGGTRLWDRRAHR
jgi:hypothetical protein